MAFSVSQNWDTLTPPATSGLGWTVDGSIVSSTAQFNSSPNSLLDNNGGTTKRFVTYSTSDTTNGASFTLIGYVRLGNPTSSNNPVRVGVTFRGSSSTLNYTNTAFYWAYVEGRFTSDFSGFGMVSVSNGVETSVVSNPGTSFLSELADKWVRITITVVGSSITAEVKRLSDNKYLSSTQNWQVGQTNVYSGTNTNIASGNYEGFGSVSYSNGASNYMDDFSYVASSGIFLPVTMDGLRFGADMNAGFRG